MTLRARILVFHPETRCSLTFCGKQLALLPNPHVAEPASEYQSNPAHNLTIHIGGHKVTYEEVTKTIVLVWAILIITIAFFAFPPGVVVNMVVTLLMFVNVIFLVRRMQTHVPSTELAKAYLVCVNLVGTLIGLLSITKFSRVTAEVFTAIMLIILGRAVQRIFIPAVPPDKEKTT